MSTARDPVIEQSYTGTIASGNARAIYGNIYGNVTISGGRDEKTLEEGAKTCSKGKRVAGTCEWIQQNETYRGWLHGQTKLLWISGGPGKGKTVLSIYLTQTLEKQSSVIYFFCSAEDERRNNAAAVLRGLLWQLLRQRKELAEHLVEYFESAERKQASLSSRETLWILFVKLAQDPRLDPVFCLLDGLDECVEDSTKWLVAKLAEFHAPESPGSSDVAVKILIVSRDISGLNSCPRIKLDPDHDGQVSEDIQVFVTCRVHELSDVIDFSESFRRYVEDALIERAGGTFLWVGFAMRELLTQRTMSDVERTIQSLPAGLPAIYDRMVLQILARDRDIAIQILNWVTLAFRPLSIRELAIAVGTPSSPLISRDQAIRDQIHSCSPLIILDGEEVGLVHQSTRDYLLRGEVSSDPVLERFRIKPAEGHLYIAQACLGHLAQSRLLYKLSHDQLDRRVHSANTMALYHQDLFLQYAIRNWSKHATYNSTLAKALLQHPSGFFEDRSALRERWWSLYSHYYVAWLIRLYEPLPPLHMACYLGNVPWVKLLLGERRKRFSIFFGKRNNKKNLAPPLYYALVQGNDKVVRLLLDRGPDINARFMDSKETLLHTAAFQGNAVSARLLLDRGARINAMDGVGETAIHHALASRNMAMVDLMLHRGADVRANKDNGMPVLHYAALYGVDACVRILDSGADVNAKDSKGQTALHIAGQYRYWAVSRLLIQRGANISVRDNDGKLARLADS